MTNNNSSANTKGLPRDEGRTLGSKGLPRQEQNKPRPTGGLPRESGERTNINTEQQ